MTDIVERLRSHANWYISCALGNVPEEANDELEAAAEITRIRSELANARNLALEEAAKLIEEGFDRTGIVKKQDTCAHGKFGWEDCEQCAVVAIRRIKAEGGSR